METPKQADARDVEYGYMEKMPEKYDRIQLRERDGSILITAVLRNREKDLHTDIVQWRDRNFVYHKMDWTLGAAIFVPANVRTINWYPEEEGEPWRG